MSWKTLYELSFFSVPHFDQFIITSRNKQCSICVESNTLYWCWVTFHNSASCWCIIAPNSDSVVSRAGSNQITAAVHRHVSNWSLVSLELVGTGIRSQTPSKNQSIIWTWYYLFETWMKNCLSDSILVSLEGFEECWVFERSSKLLQIVWSVRLKF